MNDSEATQIIESQELSADDILAIYPHLGIPHFQRGLVWGNDSISLLLESLFLGTPCGTIIFWKPIDMAREGVPLVRGTGRIHHLVLDGQQRIRSVHMALNGTGESPGEDTEPGGEGVGEQVWCLNLARIPELSRMVQGVDKYLQDQYPYPMFRLLGNPTNPKARFKHNVIPIRFFFEDRDSEVSPLIHAGNRTDDLIRAIRDCDLKGRIKRLRKHKLFPARVLTEVGGRFDLPEVVSLYNRINSGGKRVESEEVAFASLVSLCPGFGPWLEKTFSQLHPDKQVREEGTESRDDMLKRRKERAFGFKLIIRTFIQLCAYHFNYSTRSVFSFDAVDDTRFRTDIGRVRDKVVLLFNKTRDILVFTRETLRGRLHCDDLQMLPDALALLPIFQLLIRFPGLRDLEQAQSIAGSLILRLFLQRQFNQSTVLNLIDVINRSHSLGECLSKLEKKTQVHPSDLHRGLAESNSLVDRYTLLLYWLLREHGAKDLSYRQLPPERQQALVRKFGAEPLSERMEPEKQHIVPYQSLAELFSIRARGRVSRHEANNIGNITYISHDLNHFNSGLGGDRARLEEEPEDNLRSHFLAEVARKDVLDQFLSAADNNQANQARRAAFRRFCKLRRELIVSGFCKWAEELTARARVETRIEPDPQRLTPKDDDHIHRLDFPDTVEDALIRGVDTGKLRFNEKKSGKRSCCNFTAYSRNRRIICEVRLYREQRRIELVSSDTSLFKRLLKDADQCTMSFLQPPDLPDDKHSGHLYLSAAPDHADGTTIILDRLADCLEQL